MSVGEISPKLPVRGTSIPNNTMLGNNSGVAANPTSIALPIIRQVYQAAHGFVVGSVLRYTGTAYVAAQADTAADAEVVGMVSSILSANSFVLTTQGWVSGLTGLTSGTVYFLDPAVAGGLTATEPSTVGQIDKPCFIADSTTSGYFINYRGEIVTAASVSLNGRVTAQTASASSILAYTVGAADSSFIISANILITASATHSFTMTVAYTDEGNTARTLTLNFSQITGTFLTAITNVQGAGAYEGVALQIRCKAATSITFATAGTFTSVTYNAEAHIQQVS